MKTLANFADTLSEAKRSQKITAKELAQRTGLSALAVRQILSGTSAPRITNAMALAQELGLELVLVCVSTRFDGCASTVIDGRLRHRPSPMLRAVGQR